MNNFFQGGVRIDHFERQYRVYTGAFCGKSHLDEGGKIILPSSALDELARLNIVYPMLFKIHNKTKNTSTHCGVLEFSAEEGRVYIPFWMQEHLQLSPGQLVTITNATLPKGAFCKIRPQQKAFIELADPRAVLEKKLRNFSCLSKGDTIMLNYNDTNYCIDIIEVASGKGECNAISIVETDVRVEFERPADMPPSPVNTGPAPDQVFKPEIIPRGPPTAGQQQQQPQEVTPSFQPFAGSGRRLDGRPIRGVSSASTGSSVASSSTTATASSTAPTTTATSATPMVPVFGKKRRKYGEPATGPNPASASPSSTSSTSSSSQDKKDDSTGFKPFQGAGRTLK